MNWIEIFWILGMFLAAWVCYRTIKGKPDLFTSQSVFKTLNTLAWLALGLIGFIGLCIMLLKSN